MIVSRRCSALFQWFLPCVSLALAAQAAAGDHHSGLVWEKAEAGRQDLVWEAKSGQRVRVLDLRVILADPTGTGQMVAETRAHGPKDSTAVGPL